MLIFGSLGLFIIELYIGYLLSGIVMLKTFVIATHGIIKKTQKTPSKEIAKAQEIRRQYFLSKNK